MDRALLNRDSNNRIAKGNPKGTENQINRFTNT